MAPWQLSARRPPGPNLLYLPAPLGQFPSQTLRRPEASAPRSLSPAPSRGPAGAPGATGSAERRSSGAASRSAGGRRQPGAIAPSLRPTRSVPRAGRQGRPGAAPTTTSPRASRKLGPSFRAGRAARSYLQGGKRLGPAAPGRGHILRARRGLGFLPRWALRGNSRKLPPGAGFPAPSRAAAGRRLRPRAGRAGGGAGAGRLVELGRASRSLRSPGRGVEDLRGAALPGCPRRAAAYPPHHAKQRESR